VEEVYAIPLGSSVLKSGAEIIEVVEGDGG
jgi:hypothetical protein